MLLRLDFSLDTPIYIQIRNQIVMGIAGGNLRPGERLPTVRALADESGVNMMTVNKAYQLLKQEGYIAADRRSGATVTDPESRGRLSDRAELELKLIISEAKIAGIPEEAFFRICKSLYHDLEVRP